MTIHTRTCIRVACVNSRLPPRGPLATAMAVIFDRSTTCPQEKSVRADGSEPAKREEVTKEKGRRVPPRRMTLRAWETIWGWGWGWGWTLGMGVGVGVWGGG